MNTGKDWNNDGFENWQLCDTWNLSLYDQRAIKLTQNCVCFIDPYIFFVLPSVTREYSKTSIARFSTSPHPLGQWFPTFLETFFQTSPHPLGEWFPTFFMVPNLFRCCYSAEELHKICRRAAVSPPLSYAVEQWFPTFSNLRHPTERNI